MKLSEAFTKKAVVLDLKGRTGKDVVKELVAALKKAHPSEKVAAATIVDAILDREQKSGSSGLGGGIAIPHAAIEGIKGVVGAFGRAPAPIDFSAIDGQPVNLFFLLASAPERKDDYRMLLAKLSAAIRAPNVAKFLRAARTVKDVDDVFREAEDFAKV